MFKCVCRSTLYDKYLDELEEKIREEKRRHEDLDAKIREWEQKIKKQLKSMGGAFLGAYDLSLYFYWDPIYVM